MQMPEKKVHNCLDSIHKTTDYVRARRGDQCYSSTAHRLWSCFVSAISLHLNACAFSSLTGDGGIPTASGIHRMFA